MRYNKSAKWLFGIIPLVVIVMSCLWFDLHHLVIGRRLSFANVAELKVSAHFVKGEVSENIAFEGTPVFAKTVSAFQQRRRWLPSYSSFAPGVVIDAGDTRIDLGHDGVVVLEEMNEATDVWNQYTSPMTKDLEMLSEELLQFAINGETTIPE
jgi:hypothetical protein